MRCENVDRELKLCSCVCLSGIVDRFGGKSLYRCDGHYWLNCHLQHRRLLIHTSNGAAVRADF